MTDTNNNEHSQDAEALAGLPEKELDETKKILDELESEAAPKPGEEAKPGAEIEPKTPVEKKPGETEVEAGKKLEGEDGGKKPETRRETKLMPAWLHERAKADWEKREKDLLAQVAEHGGTQVTKTGEESKPVEVSVDIKKEAEALAEKHGITVELAEDLYAIAQKNGNKLPADIGEKLKALDELRDTAAIQAETASFNADFDRIVLPLIKAEYGDNVPASTIDQVREELKTKAYTPEYAKVPYTILYKGEDQFRGLVAPEKKGAEGSRGGSSAAAENAGAGDQIDLTQPLHDDVLRGLTDEQFATYEKNMEIFERNKAAKK